MITYNGHTSDEFGVRFTAPIPLNRPSRKVELVSVPGRNGDLAFEQDAFSDVQIIYDVFGPFTVQNGVYVRNSTAVDTFSDLVAWLSSTKGYLDLTDSSDITHFRKARFAEYSAPVNIRDKGWTASLIFDCHPQRYLNSGQQAVTISSAPGSITNPTAFAARPLIRVQGSGASGTVTVNGTVFTVSSTSSYTYIDCETMNCYGTNGNNKNSIVSSSTSEFATLAPGENAIGFTGGVTKLVITPRFWEL